MLFLWYKSFHIIALVAWFAGLFYLPRLFVYHTQSNDKISQDRFIIMEHKLYYYIMNPAALLTLTFGMLLLHNHAQYYFHANWMHIKLTLVFLLIIYHAYLGKILSNFKHNNNTHSSRFFRVLNEFPTLILISTIILVVVRPT